MEKNNIIDLKKIIGNSHIGGIYAITDGHAIRLLDTNNNIVSDLNIKEKIRIFNIFLDKLINFGMDKDLLNIDILFKKIMDLDNRH